MSSGSWTRALRGLLALSMVSLSVVLLVAAPSNAAAGITLDKSGPADVLVGGDVAYSLTAANPVSNPDAVAEYNLSLRDVLPVGVTYNAGSTRPASFGEPIVFTDAVTGQQTLVWRNVADLGVGSSSTLSYTASVDPLVNPVGRPMTNNAGAYTNTNPRFVPRFSATGVPTTGFTQSATDSALTTVTAIQVEKSEPSPEGELLRGIHDHTTVYGLTVTNNDGHATNGVVVVDYLPAGLEFLGCGGVDNTTTGPEYPGAASLAATPALSPCVAPTSVTTVVDPVGYPAGTYTRVLWTLGDLAAGATRTIRYAAGIPQRANTTAWPGPAPTGASLGQIANLDNNTGASTREGAVESALTNRARVDGTYQGPVYLGGSPDVGSADNATVSVEDVRLRKSADATTFAQGGEVRYTLTVDTSEYVDGTDIVLTDHIPNGLCPLSDVANYVTGTPAECDPGAAFAPTNATITGVVQNVDGSFDVTFSPLDLGADHTVQVAYSARMRTVYTGGANAGDPTTSGDSFTNTVSLQGDTTPPVSVEAPAPNGLQSVGDASSTTITAGGPSLTKSVLPDATPMDCSAGGYVSDPTRAQVSFSEGSRVCFKLRIDFPAGISTRGAILTDFLPEFLTYEAGSLQPTGNNDVPYAVDESTNDPVLTLGTAGANGTYVAPAGVLEVVLSGIATKPGAGPGPDVTANLAKLRYSDGAGSTVSLRDEVEVDVTAPPPVSIRKGVADVNGTPGGGNPVDTDGLTVRGGDVVTFRVDYSNDGTAANRNDLAVLSPDLWDVLPAGITCAEISAISDGGACTDPGDAAHPAFAARATRSAVRWDLTGAPALVAGASRTLTYDMTIPAEVGVSTVFTNTAYVASYRTATNLGGEATHLPANNVDTTADSVGWDVPAASDPSNVVVPDASVAKASTTDIVAANNNASQAVVGEMVTYRLGVVVPAGTTVYNGVLRDPMPPGLTFVSATAAFSASGTSPAAGPLPAGVTLDGANGTLTFPATYTNGTATGHRFEVTVRARVSTLAGNIHGISRTNTASFASDTAAAGGSALPARTARSTIGVRAPAPSLTKTDDDPDNVVVAGQVVTYTLTAVNATGRPTLHDAWVLDCLPGELAFGSFTAGTGAHGTPATEPSTGANGCPTGTTRISWSLPDLVAGAPRSLSYTATVSSSAAGGAAYTNTATLTGGTLDDGKADPLAADNPDERVFASTATDNVTVAGSAITKSASPTTLTIGQRGSWTINVALPAHVNFYDAAIIDLLPAGIDAASLTLDSLTCANADTTPCTVPGAAAELSAQPGAGGSTNVGWRLGDMTAHTQARTVSLTYSADVLDLAGLDRGDTLVNTAWMRWNLTDGADPTSATDTFEQTTGAAPATVTVKEPVLLVDKSVLGATPAPGDTFTYTVVVGNLAGPNTSAAHHLEVVDTVPTGVVVDPGSISNGGVLGGAGPNGGGTITWSLAGPLAPGASLQVTYAAHLADSTTLGVAGLVNTADLTHYESRPTGGRVYDGPSDSATVTPAFPHVSVAKSVNGSVAYLGESKSWTVTATSNGGSTAYGVDVVDTLPVNWTYDAGSATVSVAGGPAAQVEPTSSQAAGHQVLTWTDLGRLPVGTTIVVTFTATPGAQAVADPGIGSGVGHVNTAAVSADDATGNDHNGAAAYAGPPATATAFIHSADLAVTKTHVGTPTAGQSLSWTLRAHNNGADPAVGPFLVTDTVPAGVGAVTASGTGWACSVDVSQVACTRVNPASTLASGASFPDITVTTAIPPSTPSGTEFTNTATADARTYDPDPGNNTATDTATSGRSADLEIVKALSGAMTAGHDATYTLVVANHGPSDSTGPLAVTDTLPAGVTFVGASGPGWSCAELAGTVTCTRVGGLALGASAPAIAVTIHVPSDRGSAVENVAEVAGPEPDPVPGNNTDAVTTTPQTSADLAIEKASVGSFVAGTQGTYRFTATNFGPSDAAATVRFTDTLPAGVTHSSFTSVSGTWSCTVSGQDITCELAGSLAAGAHAIVDVTVDIAPGHSGNIHNSATITSPTTDPNPGNNTGTDDTDSTVQADLQIVKSHTGSVVAGTNATYTLAVRNNGPSDSAGPIEVTDVLPDGMSWVSATGTGWTCGHTGPTITCERPVGLAADTAAPDITVVAAVAPDAGPSTLTNLASIDGPDEDPDPGNNTDTDDTVVVDDVNVSLVKTTTGSDPVTAGENTEFTITVHNDGPSAADDVAVTDSLPAGLTLAAVTAPGWDCNTISPLVCTRATLAPGADAPPIVLTVTADSGVTDGTTLTNTAVVSTSTPGDGPADNTDQAAVGVTTDADLGLNKSHPAGTLAAGDQVTFDLAVTNSGPSDALAPVRIVDTLPAGLTYAGSNGAWTCTPGPIQATGQDVTCVLDGTAGVIAGASAPTLQLTTQIGAGVDDGTYTNSATVDSGTTDSNPGNNTDSDDVAVVTLADLSIVKSHAGPVRIGDELTFTLAVRNSGPSEARHVTVSDELPAGLDFVSATGTGWSCALVGTTVGCDLGDPLAPATDAEPISVTVRVLAAAYPSISNVAVVDSTTTDENPGDNSSGDVVDVPPMVDLAITKTHDGAVQVGDRLTYHLVVVNNGPTDDPGPVTVTDTLPTGLGFIAAGGAGWSCAEDAGQITCTDADGLAVDETGVIDLTVEVGAAAYPEVTNVATVTSDAEDSARDNNTATDPAAVAADVRLSLTKDLVHMTRTRATYRLTVTNQGLSPTISELVVVDELPDGLSYGGVASAGWSCTPAAQVVTCRSSEVLAAGESSSFVLTTVVAPGIEGLITNRAEVLASEAAGGGDTDTASGRIPDRSGGGSDVGDLPDTGGVALAWAALGLLALVSGGALVARGRRRA